MHRSDVPTLIEADEELSEIVRKTLERSDQPLTAAKIRAQLSGPFRRRAGGLEQILEGLVERGAAFRLPKYRGAYRYWNRDLETYARQMFVQTLSERSLTRSELTTKLKIKLCDLSQARQKALLDELVREGRVRKLPPLIGSRTERLTSAAVDPREYVEDALQKVVRILAKVGISEDQVLAAAGRIARTPGPQPNEGKEWSEGLRTFPEHPLTEPQLSLEQMLLERMVEIEPAARQGAMVSVAELRRALDFQPVDGKDFDRAGWELCRQGRIAVHRHGYPAGLDPAERGTLVTDDRGNFYHGLSLRTP